jgi:tRNA modification GTPase
VIRLSGPGAAKIAGRVCPHIDFDRPRRAVLTPVRNQGGTTIERGVAVAYSAPGSYTGEDLLELTVHGSPFLVSAVIEACLAAGARRAHPGEFTRRAVANGKMDLVQAEAVQDLVDAETAWQLSNARRQLEGALSREFSGLRETLVALLAAYEADLDYEAQGVSVAAVETEGQLGACRQKIADLVATADAGRRIRDGARVVILGPANSGKSTLFNALCGFERAITSPEPGTTRDVLEAELDLGGVAAVVQDTAGLRRTEGLVEAEGHRRALSAAAEADVVILMRGVDAEGDEGVPDLPHGAAVLRLCSKSDLAPDHDAAPGWLRVSCHSGEGLAELRNRLAETVSGEIPDLGGAVAIAGRHREALERAASELSGCEAETPEVAAERVRWALKAVSELIGEVDSEEVLDAVYDAFCIGK